MIHLLQRNIETLYRLDSYPSANNYLLTASEFCKLRDKLPKDPQVLFLEEGEDVSLGIFLGDQILKKIRSNPESYSFPDFCIMAEEISHFVYLLWSKFNQKKISLLDLELQGEIDKFLLAALWYRNEDLIYTKMFKQFSIKTHLPEYDRERYMEAHNLGKKFVCDWMKNKSSLRSKIRWLRSFYRQNFSGRISMIQQGLS